MHENHRERMRERFLKDNNGNHFEKHELLEMLLFYSIRQGDTNETGHRLINTFGSLQNVLEAPFDELVAVKGVGNQSACLIKLVQAVTRRYIEEKSVVPDVLNSTELAGRFLMSKYFGATEEKVSLLCLDSGGRLINWVVIHEGSFNAVEVSVRKVIETVIRLNACSFIVAHNHPGGIALPSDADVHTTKNIINATKIVGITCADHFIIADDDYVSMAESRKFYKLFM